MSILRLHINMSQWAKRTFILGLFVFICAVNTQIVHKQSIEHWSQPICEECVATPQLLSGGEISALPAVAKPNLQPHSKVENTDFSQIPSPFEARGPPTI